MSKLNVSIFSTLAHSTPLPTSAKPQLRSKQATDTWKGGLFSLAALCVLAPTLSGCTGRSVPGDQASSDGQESAEQNAEETPMEEGNPTSTSTEGGEDSSGGGEDPSGGEEESSFPDVPEEERGCGVECDPWAQDCPEGQKCTPMVCEPGMTDSHHFCVPAGDAQPGEECQQVGENGPHEDDCAKGSMCWDYDEEGIGTCIAFCVGSPDEPSCEDEKTACVVTGSGSLPICVPTCDPLEQDCSNGDLCIQSFSEDKFICVLNSSGDMAPYGTPCMFANACNKGLYCIGTEYVGEESCGASDSCCSPFCDVTDPKCPGSEQICEPWFEEEVPGYENVGICIIPEGGAEENSEEESESETGDTDSDGDTEGETGDTGG